MCDSISRLQAKIKTHNSVCTTSAGVVAIDHSLCQLWNGEIVSSDRPSLWGTYLLRHGIPDLHPPYQAHVGIDGE